MIKKLKSFMIAISYVAIYFLVQSVVILAVPITDFIRDLFSGTNDFGLLIEEFVIKSDMITYDINYISVITAVITAIIFTLIIWGRRKRISDFIKSKPLKLMHFIIAVVLTVGLNLVAVFVTSLDIFEGAMPEYQKTVGNLLGSNIWLTLGAVGLLMPAFEEIMYRGMIFKELRLGGFGAISANILQALIFGVMHGNIVQGTYAAIIGFVLGLAYHKSGSIYFVILVHVLFNSANVLMTSTALFTALPFFLIVGVAGCVAALYMLDRRVR